MELQHPLVLLPSHLSSSEKNPNCSTNFSLKLNHPLLARLECCTNMHQLRQLHAQMVTTGLFHETFAASRLLAFCAFSVHGDLNYALRLFNQIPNPNLFIWNAMIRAFSRSNRPQNSLLFYLDMLLYGCSPDSYTFPFLLKSCAHLSAFSEGKQIHTHVLKAGLSSDLFVANSLVHMYSECGCVENAGLVFEKMPEHERNEVSWASLIAGFVNNGLPEQALALFLANDWKKMSVDQITLVTALSACSRVRDLDLGREIHGYIVEEGIEMGTPLCNSLMNMYAKCGSIEVAENLFNNMAERDLVSWNVIISGLSGNGFPEKSLLLLDKMKLSGVRPDEATFLSLITACKQLDFALVIHNLVREMGIESHILICNALIDMYSRIGNVEMGRNLFDKMPVREIVTWNSIIAGYCRSGSMEAARFLFSQMPEKDNYSWSTMILGYVRLNQPEEAVQLYKLLQLQGLEPDKVTMIAVLSACSQLGVLEEGKLVHAYIKKIKMGVDAQLGTALIDMYSKCGCLEKAVDVFDGLSSRDVLAWTALISALAMHGRAKEALLAFIEMQQCAGGKQIRPNSITFISLLSACAHAGLVEEGRSLYNRMLKEYRIQPSMQHNGCMVDLLGRAGYLEEAADFIASLGSDADVLVWGALLGACRIHKNVELAEFAMSKILELDPAHHGTHVLMSNIYADSGRHEESRRIRRRMKEKEIAKEVGCSWIEVNGTRCEFTAGDAHSDETD